VAAGIDAMHQPQDQAALEGGPEEMIELHVNLFLSEVENLMSPRVPDIRLSVK
jgi:hypothetical protein